MPDREKVIKGLQCIIEGTVRCESCGYSIDKHGHHSCQQNCASDAIAMLKEQKTVKKVLADRQCEVSPHYYERKGFCPKCHQEVKLILNRNYCGFCGQKVKWDE